MVRADGGVNREVADLALEMLEVDKRGLDSMDHKYLKCIGVNYNGGPVGIETLAAALSEPRDAIEEIIEPYLIQTGLVQRTPRGRMLSPQGFDHIKVTMPQNLTKKPQKSQMNLLEE
ncbi:MAG: hypothetical protein COA93_11250 [Alphaproteobacteria bacterium]|nr:MAG: hypothetical protein COA93_11250 [Alphaproteobacteria bacterium]